MFGKTWIVGGVLVLAALMFGVTSSVYSQTGWAD